MIDTTGFNVGDPPDLSGMIRREETYYLTIGDLISIGEGGLVQEPDQIEMQLTRSPGCNTALDIVWQYGEVGGAHHKQWVIDQMLRALLGDDYDVWIDSLVRNNSGKVVFTWDTGIAP